MFDSIEVENVTQKDCISPYFQFSLTFQQLTTPINTTRLNLTSQWDGDLEIK